MKKILTIVGTRPELIKMAPVLRELEMRTKVDSRLCVTSQHRQMLDQFLEIFDFKPDYDLDVMTPNQTLTSITTAVIEGMKGVLEDFKPDWVLVHGDTTTTFASALAAFYQQIPVAHVEAGLRTRLLYSPFPEEMNRSLTSKLASLHLAPTKKSYDNLISESISHDAIEITGNTVVDSFVSMLEKVENDDNLISRLENKFDFLDTDKPIVLVTGHRRESFGNGFNSICKAIHKLASEENIQFVYPVHLNPNVQGPVNEILGGLDNVYLLEPMDYLPFIYLMERSHIILTDSGGIQEEAPSISKPVLVMRECTERPEALEAGAAILVGTDEEKIVTTVKSLLQDKKLYESMASVPNPYGDGKAAVRIVDAVLAYDK